MSLFGYLLKMSLSLIRTTTATKCYPVVEFTDLPDDVLLLILQAVDVQTIVRFRQVNNQK